MDTSDHPGVLSPGVPEHPGVPVVLSPGVLERPERPEQEEKNKFKGNLGARRRAGKNKVSNVVHSTDVSPVIPTKDTSAVDEEKSPVPSSPSPLQQPTQPHQQTSLQSRKHLSQHLQHPSQQPTHPLQHPSQPHPPSGKTQDFTAELNLISQRLSEISERLSLSENSEIDNNLLLKEILKRLDLIASGIDIFINMDSKINRIDVKINGLATLIAALESKNSQALANIIKQQEKINDNVVSLASCVVLTSGVTVSSINSMVSGRGENKVPIPSSDLLDLIEMGEDTSK